MVLMSSNSKERVSYYEEYYYLYNPYFNLCIVLRCSWECYSDGSKEVEFVEVVFPTTGVSVRLYFEDGYITSIVIPLTSAVHGEVELHFDGDDGVVELPNGKVCDYVIESLVELVHESVELSRSERLVP